MWTGIYYIRPLKCSSCEEPYAIYILWILRFGGTASRLYNELKYLEDEVATSTSHFIEKKFVGSPVDVGKSANHYGDTLMEGEQVHLEYKGIRDAAVFTDRRLIIIDPQGLRGKKVALVSIPWKNISAFSVENAGTFDFDAELKIWGSGYSMCELQFTKGVDVKEINLFLCSKVFGS